LHENPILESGTFVIFAYIAYLFAQGIGCSGFSFFSLEYQILIQDLIKKIT